MTFAIITPALIVGGILGTLMAGIFASSELGLFSGQGLAEGMTIASQVGAQFIGVVATFAYTAIATYIILKVVGMMVGLRVSPKEQQQGLDISAH